MQGLLGYCLAGRSFLSGTPLISIKSLLLLIIVWWHGVVPHKSTHKPLASFFVSKEAQASASRAIPSAVPRRLGRRYR